MAPACSSTAKFLLSTSFLDRFSLSILTRSGGSSSRRGYASAGGAVVNNMIRGSGDNKKTVKKASWVPDPKTGYYMPENHQQHLEHDVAQILFKNNDGGVDVSRRTR